MGTGELEILGLAAAEIELYETLIDHGVATSTELATVAPMNSETIAQALAALEVKGLARRGPGADGTYSAIPPEVGAELLLRAREAELIRARRAVDELTARFRQARISRPPDQMIEVIVGQSEVNQQYVALSRSGQREVRIMSRPPYHQTDEENRDLAEEFRERGVLVRSIIDSGYFDEGTELEAIRDDIAHGEAYRVVRDVPIKLTIADGEQAILPLENPPHGIQSALLVHPSALLRALSDLFETFWRYALPLDLLRVQDELRDPLAPNEDERKLISLLASGVPDTVIQRQLGLSRRTVLRRVQDLKDRLGASSRFQAGVQAALRGWITDAGVPEGSASAVER